MGDIVKGDTRHDRYDFLVGTEGEGLSYGLPHGRTQAKDHDVGCIDHRLVVGDFYAEIEGGKGGSGFCVALTHPNVMPLAGDKSRHRGRDMSGA